MTPAEIIQLAEYHEERGANALNLARVMKRPINQKFERQAAVHIGWAVDLRELAGEIVTLKEGAKS